MRKSMIALAAIVLLFSGLTAIAVAQTDGNTYSACLRHNNKLVKVAIGGTPSSPCKPGQEIQISWNQEGIQGEQGEPGAQGIQGLQGEKGEQGEAGAQGIQGIQGEQGEPGAQGIQGLQGEKGEQGEAGAQGIQGIQGEQGPPGEPYVTGFYTASSGPVSVPPGGGVVDILASCVEGHRATGGGFSLSASSLDIVRSSWGNENYEWLVQVHNTGTFGHNASAWVVCAELS